MDLYWYQVKIRGMGLGYCLQIGFRILTPAQLNSRNQSWLDDLRSWPEMLAASYHTDLRPAKLYRIQLEPVPEWDRP